MPRPRSEIGRSSFKHRAALAWSLAHHVKDCANLRSFKIGLNANKYLLNSINFARGFLVGRVEIDTFRSFVGYRMFLAFPWIITYFRWSSAIDDFRPRVHIISEETFNGFRKMPDFVNSNDDVPFLYCFL